MSEPRHLDHLDALRGYAILAVIATHVGSAFPGLPPIAHHALQSGQTGVQLFFVVSAVTLLHSWTARHDGAGPFYLRRFFRIAPMWMLAVVGWTILRGTAPTYWAPWGLSPWDIVAALTFVHGWLPQAINGVVPGGWSIGAEAMFYLIFPVLAAIVTTRLRAVAFVVLGVLSGLVLQGLVSAWLGPIEPAHAKAAFFYFWFPNQLPAFASGFLAFQLIDKTALPRWGAELAVLLAVAILVVLPVLGPVPGPILYGAIFALAAFGMGKGGGRWLVSRLVIWCGKRSYSAYFWHLALLNEGYLPPQPGGLPAFLLRFVLITGLTLALSEVSYRLIERPGIEFGRRLLTRLKAAPTPAAVPG
jgi:exopolysaccharide production protein ExoZ